MANVPIGRSSLAPATRPGTLVATFVLVLAPTLSAQSGCRAPDDTSARIVHYVSFVLTDTSQASARTRESEGPAGGVVSSRDPATQAPAGLRPDGRADLVRRRPGHSHQRPGARHAGNAGPAPGALAHVRGRRRRDVQPDPGHLALPGRRCHREAGIPAHRAGGGLPV